jgi:hypothetical protein
VDEQTKEAVQDLYSSIVTLGGLDIKHAVRRGILIQTRHFHQD